MRADSGPRPPKRSYNTPASNSTAPGIDCWRYSSPGGADRGQLLEAINRRYALELIRAEQIKPRNRDQADLHRPAGADENEDAEATLGTAGDGETGAGATGPSQTGRVGASRGERSAMRRKATFASCGPGARNCGRSPIFRSRRRTRIPNPGRSGPSRRFSGPRWIGCPPRSTARANGCKRSDRLRGGTPCAAGSDHGSGLLINAHAQILEQKLQGLKNGRTTPTKTALAIKLVEDTPEGVLRSLPANTKQQLLHHVRGGREGQPTSRDRKDIGVQTGAVEDLSRDLARCRLPRSGEGAARKPHR